MCLGDHFPAAIKQASAIRQLVPGAVIKMTAVMDDGRVHEKRFLVVHVDENTIACVINSEIHPLISNRPSMLKCQVMIDKEAHPFMQWESHIDCSRVRIYPTADVIESIANKPEWVLGTINSDLRDQIVAAIKHAPQISPINAGIYSASLESAKSL